jgi:hypothetical protein
LDIELYDFAKEILIPEYLRQSRARTDAKLFDELDRLPAAGKVRSYLDAGYRKGYVEVATGLIRKRNGMPMKGSY